MPRKRAKSEKEDVKEALQEMEVADLDLEEELAPEELESLEEEFAEEEMLEDLDEGQLEEMVVAENTVEETPVVGTDKRRHASARAAVVEGDDEMDAFEADEYEEEEEAIPEVPVRRETRQELLGRLMSQLLAGREDVHMALERVRDLNTQLRDAGSRPPEKLKESYHRAISELSRARREENFARAELMQVLSWRG